MTSDSTTIGIPIYPGFDMLDVAGPYEVFSWIESMWPDHKVDVLVIGKSLDPVASSHGLALTPTARFSDPKLRLDVLFVPGAPTRPLQAVMEDRTYMSFLRKQSETARYVCSVCVGALLLARAGLLADFQATTHWASLDDLKSTYPAVKVVNGYPRYVIDGNRVTGAGISSGLDQALAIVRLITGSSQVAEQVQLAIQYSPSPPFDSGNPYTAAYDVYTATIAGFANL
jgi:transcriptional regulator GlxA family with amidase domain